MIEFTPYPKTARLFKDGLSMVVTEKLDGTNAAVGVVEFPVSETTQMAPHCALVPAGDTMYGVYAQSRNRLIKPEAIAGKGSDNYGFAAWVDENATALARTLGPGVHFGEWWGQGIARKYGMTEKRFSLFNTSRFAHLNSAEARLSLGAPGQLGVVPVLYVGQLDRESVMACMLHLKREGSAAAPGFDNPEGVCVYLPSVRQTFKVTFDGDKPKWQVTALAA